MFNSEEFCLRVGIEQTTLQLWVSEGWLMAPQADPAFLLSDVDLRPCSPDLRSAGWHGCQRREHWDHP